jgi:hypothetical protein
MARRKLKSGPTAIVASATDHFAKRDAGIFNLAPRYCAGVQASFAKCPER